MCAGQNPALRRGVVRHGTGGHPLKPALFHGPPCTDVSGTQLPLKALRVLLERGRPEAALLLARQRCLPAQTRDLEEASAALSICLASGLLAEAVLRVRPCRAGAG